MVVPSGSSICDIANRVTFLKRPLLEAEVTIPFEGEKRLRFLATEGSTAWTEGLKKDMLMLTFSKTKS